MSLSLRFQVLLYSSLHLTRAVLSWLQDDDGELTKQLGHALAWLRDAGHLCVSAELSKLLFPDGTSVFQHHHRTRLLPFGSRIHIEH